MAIPVGKELPSRVLSILGRSAGRNKGKVLLILTTDSSGWPHVAMLSHWEVFAGDAKNIRIATYASSGTTENILRTKKVTVVLVERATAYYVKGTAEPQVAPKLGGNLFFNVRVDSVLKDGLPGSKITTGIRYVEERKVESHEDVRRKIEKEWEA